MLNVRPTDQLILAGQAMTNESRRGGHEVFEYFFAKRYRREQRAFPTPKKSTGNRSTEVLFDNAPVAAFAGAFLGCLTTLGLSAFGIVPCVASALATALLCGQLLVTRTAGLFAGAFFPALYGGTFGGMTPVVWLGGGAPGHSAMLTGLLFISLSIVCGLAFFIVARLDSRSAVLFGSGYGGRLGAIAATASFVFVAFAGLLGADAGRFHDVRVGAVGPELWAATPGFFACLGGALCTMFALRQPRVAAVGGAIRTSVASAVALVGLLTLHLANPGDTHTLEALYAGCFLGMSTPERLTGWFQPLFGALVLTAMLVLVRAFLPSIGGGLGLAAFVSVALLTAWTRATARLRQMARASVWLPKGGFSTMPRCGACLDRMTDAVIERPSASRQSSGKLHYATSNRRSAINRRTSVSNMTAVA